MIDQAEALRRKVERFNTERTKVIAVLSGKGGVGKSIFSVNFALALNKLEKKTLLVDLDIGMGNVDILLGLHPLHHIVDMINKRLPIETVITHHQSGLAILSGANGLTDLFQLSGGHFDYFLSQFQRLKQMYDVVIFDLGAGITQDTLQFIAAVHEVLLVTTTEPTSLTDAYSVVKMIHNTHPSLPIRCVINRYDDEQEAEGTWKKLSYASERFLGKRLTLLGGLPRDRAVIKAVKAQIPFLMSEPKSKVSLGVNQLAVKFLHGELGIEPSTMDSFVDKLKHLFRLKGG